jgi:hypothetical protein
MKIRGWVEVRIHELVTWALDGYKWSGSHSGPFKPQEKYHDINWIVNWAELKAGLDVVQKRKICYPYRESNPDFTVQPQHLTYVVRRLDSPHSKQYIDKH